MRTIVYCRYLVSRIGLISVTGCMRHVVDPEDVSISPVIGDIYGNIIVLFSILLLHTHTRIIRTLFVQRDISDININIGYTCDSVGRIYNIENNIIDVGSIIICITPLFLLIYVSICSVMLLTCIGTTNLLHIFAGGDDTHEVAESIARADRKYISRLKFALVRLLSVIFLPLSLMIVFIGELPLWLFIRVFGLWILTEETQPPPPPIPPPLPRDTIVVFNNEFEKTYTHTHTHTNELGEITPVTHVNDKHTHTHTHILMN
eukprot:GHVR01165645.1.p1 GENE.GHVR01165645.1~~GHVR01165645.1.p1  ORF type:complete len:261 (+),score=92.55 GHVR01165645.1:290-1072(+)